MPTPRATTEPGTPAMVHTLLDGTRVEVRALGAADKEAERAFIKRLSNDSCRFRFRGTIPDPGERFLERLTRVDPNHECVFAAFAHVPRDGEQLVGVSRYSIDSDGRQCECAVAVADGWQHRGLGTLLMRDLIEVARSKGIRSMRSVDSAANTAMWELATYLGFHTRRNPDDPGEVIHELELS